MEDHRVTVVLSADNKYSMPLTVAARSVVDQLQADRQLDLCVLDMGVDRENREKIQASLSAPRVELRWIDSLKDSVAHLPNTWPVITRATYARLFIPGVLPPSVRRAIYLDCDVLLRRCAGDLFFSDMRGFAAMAVLDFQSPFVCSPYAVPLWFEAGRAASEFNFNAGVMLMDLDSWRGGQHAEEALRYLTDGRHHFAQDQEAINVALAGRIGALDPRWNQQSELFLKQYEVLLPYSRETLNQLREEPFIVHYSNRQKPWHYGYEHPLLDEWFRCLDRTAYRGWRPKQSGKEKAAEIIRGGRGIARRAKQRLKRLHQQLTGGSAAGRSER